MQRSDSFPRFFRSLPAMAVAALLLAGCAQHREPNYYSMQRDNTESDARHQAQGRHDAIAPSQIQLGFGENAKKPGEDNTPSPQAQAQAALRPLSQPRTFLGTVPCLIGSSTDCAASRITLTLAPTGEWRARTHYLGGSGQQPDLLEQGCWEAIGMQPARILLQTNSKQNKADFTFVTDNILRVNMLNNIRPKLEYRLTRQADVDPIDELSAKAPLDCGKTQ